MSDKLKPCPFCGGNAVYIEKRDIFISKFVTCAKCGIETRRNYLRKDKAIEHWNTRKPMERLVERLEESKGVVIIDGKEMYQEDYFIDIDEAIEIVKEEGAV